MKLLKRIHKTGRDGERLRQDGGISVDPGLRSRYISSGGRGGGVEGEAGFEDQAVYWL